MLVLTRKLNEWIYVDGERIKVVVLRIKGRSVVLGLVAESDVQILRAELVEPE
jgi:carbon storage regulator CsrA